MPPIHSAIRNVSIAILLGLLAGCPAGQSGETGSTNVDAATAKSDPGNSAADAAAAETDTQAAPSGQENMTWRAYIDPQMTMDEIEALSEDEARAKLDELGVPFEAFNFHEAIEMDPLELCALFLQAGMPVDTPNMAGVSPLQAASYQQKTEHMKLFIEHGADVNYEDPRFRATAVDFAVGSGNMEVLQILLDQGADPAGGSQSRPILIDAIESGSMDMFNFIYEKFPDVTVTDRTGQGTLMNACLTGHLEIAQRLVELGAEINQVEPQGGTPLAAAAYRGNWEIFDFLMQHGADPMQSYRGNRNLLFEFGYHQDYPHELAEQLIEQGMDINQQDERSGVTPLINAANNANMDLVKLLLDHDADPDKRDVNGMSACDFAKFTENGDMVLLFSKYGITSEREFPQQ